jgi:hypothetical protein
MSSTQSQTGYQFDVESTDPASGNGLEIDFTVTATEAFGDAEAFTLLANIRDAFPDSWTTSGTVMKSQNSQTGYTTDMTSTPPSFT